MATAISLERVAVLADPGDNCAVATRTLTAGLLLEFQGDTIRLRSNLPEGHRFAVRPIPKDQCLLSWGLPFGVSSETILPGNWVINQTTLEELRSRRTTLQLPAHPNFRDENRPFLLDRESFRQGKQVACGARNGFFMGYRRSHTRGVGTRSYILLLGVSSRAGSFVRMLERDLRGGRARNLDGIVAVAHTEAGDPETPNNRNLLLRTLSGIVVHPNCAAVLVVDEGSEPVSGTLLKSYMEDQGYPLQDVPHRFLSLRSSLSDSLDAGGAIVRGWLESLQFPPRSKEDLRHLKLALQCGGSDAFSGISANPLLGWVARQIVRHGGCANLAETDELIGAESYVLANVRDFDTASRFLEVMDRFKTWASWHRQEAEGNLSGGNRFRGLYNITLKSIGAAMKRLPDVRIDSVLEYGERMLEPGFHFMDSPGNDLESVAGQVASGCNLVFFSTGNGSVTNHPFVPTVKVVSTSQRFQRLPNEMDVNAGEYLDGEPMDRLGARTVGLTIEVASGKRTKGEEAGHWQLSIWRNWRQVRDPGLALHLESLPASGVPLPVRIGSSKPAEIHIDALVNPRGIALERVGLVLPNSLCSGQVARMMADRLNAASIGREQGISRFVSLVHTEGCGVSSGPSLEIFTNTLLGYLRHPSVVLAACLEHGCEKTHNDFLRARLSAEEVTSNRLAFFSVQGGGGLENVLAEGERWFRSAAAELQPAEHRKSGLLAHLSVGMLSDGPVESSLSGVLADFVRAIVHSGGTVIVPEESQMFRPGTQNSPLSGRGSWKATLDYGRSPGTPGFHVLRCSTRHLVEQLTGLGSCGVGLILAVINEHPIQTHPLVPVIQLTSDPHTGRAFSEDLDIVLSDPREGWMTQIWECIRSVASRECRPRLFARGYSDFQVTRGLLGISL